MSDDYELHPPEERLEQWLAAGNRDPQLMSAVRNRAGNMKAAVMAVLEARDVDFDDDERAHVLYWFLPTAGPVLLDVLADHPEGRCRAIAATLMGGEQKFLNPDVVAALVRALSDPDDDVLMSVVAALSGRELRWNEDPFEERWDEYGHPYCKLQRPLTRELHPALNSGNVRVRVGAAAALSFGRDRSTTVTQALADGLKSPDELLRLLASRAAYWGQNAAVAGLEEGLSDPDYRVRFWCAAACAHGAHGNPADVMHQLVERAQFEPTWSFGYKPVRDDAIRALGAAAVPFLIELLEQADAELSGEALNHLRNLREVARPAMLHAVAEFPLLRCNWRFLAAMEHVTGEPCIDEALRDDLPAVRRAAVEVLSRRIGSSRFVDGDISGKLRRAVKAESDPSLADLMRREEARAMRSSVNG